MYLLREHARGRADIYKIEAENKGEPTIYRHRGKQVFIYQLRGESTKQIPKTIQPNQRTLHHILVGIFYRQ